VFFVLVLATSGIWRTSAIGAGSNKANDAAVSIFEILDRKSKIDYSSEQGGIITNVRGDRFPERLLQLPIATKCSDLQGSIVECFFWKGCSFI
jgi:hypothetical protein